MVNHRSLFVFDIETIPDIEAVPHLLNTEETDTNRLRQELTEYHLEITAGKNDFPRHPFHKVVAISFIEAEIEKNGKEESYTLKDIRSGGKEDATEQELVQGFFQHLSRALPRLVTYNGRTFDLPVLKYRAMKHGIAAPWLYQSGDKWNSYTNRYSADWHCDLIEILSDYGASARCKMNEVCAILGFPGKFGVDGSKVTDMYDAGDIKAIRNYCETDVINTYLLYLRHAFHTGTLSKEGYNKSIEDVVSFILNQKEEKPHLAEFLVAWEEACNKKFTL